jgi:hypothetical protein
MMDRQAGKRGRLPVKPVGKRFAIQWAHEYLAAPLPPPIYPIDVTGGITAFEMLGNDKFGDCGEAGERHLEMTTAAGAGAPIPHVTTAEAVKEYFAFTGGKDTGVNLADFLLWLYNQKRILAFAPLDTSNTAQCDAFMAAGYGTYDGVNLTDDAEDLFNSGKPWTIANGEQPDPSEGHCIVSAGAAGPNDTDLDTKITWGAKQSATRAWSKACTDERWLVVTNEEQAAKFTPALFADIEALKGTGGPGSPTPTPTPPPAPSPAAGCLLSAIAIVVVMLLVVFVALGL